ncbi:type I restriction modification system, restriction subunit [mine drainage metagenome]|uniref:Type I restriction modification system, restriction subunit n=1 Tax=mine drainage metagenome TaxID=410659 RepID=T0Z3B3_9ZZZZ
MTPEQQVRTAIDTLLAAAGWVVQDVGAVHIHAARGVAIREFPLRAGPGRVLPRSTHPLPSLRC